MKFLLLSDHLMAWVFDPYTVLCFDVLCLLFAYLYIHMETEVREHL